jgi:hypothetical protein
MKKLIKFIVLCVAAWIPFQQTFAADATDYDTLNDEIIAAASNPAPNYITLSTDVITLGGSISPILNKTIAFIGNGLSGTTVIDAAGQYKGFTASAGSNIAFTGVNFQNARNGADGGFVKISASTASFNGPVNFTNGKAQNGGSLAISGNSYAHFTDTASFVSNSAADYGGGF